MRDKKYHYFIICKINSVLLFSFAGARGSCNARRAELQVCAPALRLQSRQRYRLPAQACSLKEALRIRKLSLGHECAEVADTLNNLASVFVKQERLADGEAMYKEALRIKEKLHGHESLSVAITLSSLAALHQSQGRLAEAEAMHKEALRIEEL